MRVDSVTAGRGVIGMMACPVAPEDFATLAAWRPDVVVTLLPLHELSRLGVPDIGARVESLGATWHHLPIRDMQAPGAGDGAERWEAAWTAARLAEVVQGGARLLIHCRAGLGRTGTIAARLLVDLGLPPGKAITAVRAARPGTVETAAQDAYLRGLRGSAIG